MRLPNHEARSTLFARFVRADLPHKRAIPRVWRVKIDPQHIAGHLFNMDGRKSACAHWSCVPKSSTLPAIVASFQGGLIDKLERADRNLIVREVAEIFRVTPGTVYRLARKHAIPSFRFGGTLLFNPQALARWMRGAA